MRAIHIMADGTVRDSIEGVVITNDKFYKVIQRLIEEGWYDNEARKTANSGSMQTNGDMGTQL